MDMGYDTYMVFVNTNLEIIWNEMKKETEFWDAIGKSWGRCTKQYWFSRFVRWF